MVMVRRGMAENLRAGSAMDEASKGGEPNSKSDMKLIITNIMD